MSSQKSKQSTAKSRAADGASRATDQPAEGSGKNTAANSKNGSGAQTARENPEEKYEKFANDIKEEIATNQLRTMLCKKNLSLLEKSVERFKAEATNCDNKDELSLRADEELQYLTLRNELHAAMNARDLDQLLDVCKRVDEADRRFKNPFTADMMMARKLICMLSRNVDLPEKMDFSDRTMRELAQFSSPPKAIHDVVIAALLLLGEYEGHTQDWVYCRDLLRPYKSTGRGGLRYRIENFNAETLNAEIAGRAKMLVDKYSITDIFRVSEAAASLYVWTRSKLDDVSPGEPAKLKRQREILNVEVPSDDWKPRNHF